MKSNLMIATQAPAAATAGRLATVRIETDRGVYTGRLFLTHPGMRVLDLLSDASLFIGLHDVSSGDSSTVEHFLALGKQFIRTVRVLHESDPEVRPSVARLFGSLDAACGAARS